jgi:hypothetical protein
VKLLPSAHGQQGHHPADHTGVRDMSNFDDVKRKFSNHRDWRGFIAAVQCSVTYPKAIDALRSGRARFSGWTVPSPKWLMIGEELDDEFSVRQP